MRFLSRLFLLCVLAGSVQAQNLVSMEYYKDSTMVQRLNSSTKLAIAATTVDSKGKKNKQDKETQMLLENEFQDKAFQGGGSKFGRALPGQRDFLYDQKVSPSKFAARSFLGIKNPWFGKKVAPTGAASLWSKTLVANADKEFPLESAEVRPYYQAGKKASERETPVPTRSTTVDGKSQGFLSMVSSQNNLTVEQVKELLNKQ